MLLDEEEVKVPLRVSGNETVRQDIGFIWDKENLGWLPYLWL
jgi:hypothetical protein